MNYAYIFNEKRAQILQLFSSKPRMRNAGWSRPTKKAFTRELFMSNHEMGDGGHVLAPAEAQRNTQRDEGATIRMFFRV